MLAHEYDPERVIFPAYIQPKIDGIRGIFSHSEKKFFSRRGKEIKVSEKLISNFVKFSYDLDGELFLPGKSFNYSSGIIRSLDYVPEKEGIHYIIFDVISPGNYLDRLNLLRDYLAPNSYFGILDAYSVSNEASIKTFYECFLAQGYEGAIVRNNTPYEHKRSFNLLKLKPTKSLICKITGMIEGTGKYEGTLGALSVITDEGKTFNVGTGFTDIERDFFWNQEPLALDGTKVRISFQDYSEYGIPRHPSYKGLVP